MDVHKALGADLHVRLGEHVECLRHHAGDRILDRHAAVVGVPVVHCHEHVVYRVDRLERGAMPESLDRGKMAERTLWTPVSDRQRFLRGTGGANDLSEDADELPSLERPWI